MGEAASQNKNILGPIRKCGEDSNMDCDICIRISRYRKKEI